MIDREKVINGLNCCCQTDGYDCSKCPYNIADSDCTALLSMDVLAMLKEQEAKAVEHQIVEQVPMQKEVKGICPHCKSIIVFRSGQFCDKCGKKVQWG